MYDALKEYKQLLDEGVITEEEFENKKREILGMPNKEAEENAIRQQRMEEEKRKKALEEEERAQAEHKRRLEEERIAEREHQRKLEEAKLLEQERQRKIEEEKQAEAIKKKEEKIVKKAKKKEKRRKVLIALGVAFFILIVISIVNDNRYDVDNYQDTTDYNSVYEWPVSGLAKDVPKPVIETGEISNNNDTMFDFYIYQAEYKDYTAYVDACKQFGYINIDEELDTEYCAYNEAKDRYVEINYYDDDNKIYIVVRAPRNWTDIYWPKSEIAKTLPVPDKLFGYVSWDDSDSLDIYIAGVTRQEFNDYINKCMDAGYNVDYSRYDDYYSAEDTNGNQLYIYYKEFDVMNIDANLN